MTTCHFSSRIPSDLSPNRLASLVDRLRHEGRDLIDLTESNPTRVGLSYPRTLLRPLGDPRGLTYDPEPLGLPAAREAVAADFRRRGLEVPASRVVITASTSEAYSLLFKLLCDSGDEVVVPRPSYPLFDHLTRLDSVVVRPYDLDYNGRWVVDLDSVSRALSPRTRAVLLVNPNNPTGSFVSPSELDALAEICERHALALIGDEVFADYALQVSPGDMTSVLAQGRALAFSLGGLSKTAGLPQVKLGWMCLGGPAAAVAAARSRLELICDTYLSVSTLVQAACAELLEASAPVRSAILERVTANHGQLQRGVAQHPACTLLNAEGGWYGVVQVPLIGGEESLVLALAEQDHVLVHPGFFFDFPREAFLVVSLLPRPAVFTRGIERVLERAVEDST